MPFLIVTIFKINSFLEARSKSSSCQKFKQIENYEFNNLISFLSETQYVKYIIEIKIKIPYQILLNN